MSCHLLILTILIMFKLLNLNNVIKKFFQTCLYLLYGLLLDIFLLNQIGPHLTVFIILLLMISVIKNYLYNLSSIKVFYFIFSLIFVIYFFEMIIADLFFNYNFNFSNYFTVSITSSIILLPTTFLFSKLDKI